MYIFVNTLHKGDKKDNNNHHHHHLQHHTDKYNILALRSSTLALSDYFLYVTYTTGFPLSGPDSWVVWTSLPPSMSIHIAWMTEGLSCFKIAVF
jgi:hypothetical protein